MRSELQRETIRHRLMASHLLDLAQLLPLEKFIKRNDCQNILLVRLDAQEAELATGLTQRYGAGLAQPKAPGVLDFHTAMADVDDLDRTQTAGRDGAPRFDVEQLARWISVAPCFPVPIAKQAGAFSDRISVGRALNKDISLRSRNISKFHAWFEHDEQGRLCVADAGSKNGTTVNGTALAARTLVPVTAGDDIRIGKIETTVCTGELFWHLVQSL